MQREASCQEARDAMYPRGLVIAIAKDPQGRYNPITLGWSMNTSQDPPMVAVSIRTTHHSVTAFRHSRAFVVAVPAEGQRDEAMLFGTRHGRDCDKLALAGAKTQPAAKIDGVLLADAVANFECTLVGEMLTGDHIIFVGQVVCAHVNRTPLRRLYIVGPNHQLGGLPKA